MNRIAMRLSPPAQHDTPKKQEHHRRPDRPAMSLVLHHSAKVIRQTAADREYREHLQEVREWRWILERVGRICVRVTASIRAQHLNRYRSEEHTSELQS